MRFKDSKFKDSIPNRRSSSRDQRDSKIEVDLLRGFKVLRN